MYYYLVDFIVHVYQWVDLHHMDRAILYSVGDQIEFAKPVRHWLQNLRNCFFVH